MQLTIKGRIPSKKNQKIIVCRGRFPLLLPSKNYQKWHKEASAQIISLVPEKPVESCNIVLTLFAPDKRKADLTNKAESIMDLLVDLGFLLDDNWFVVKSLKLIFGGVEKDNPRVIVDIL